MASAANARLAIGYVPTPLRGVPAARRLRRPVGNMSYTAHVPCAAMRLFGGYAPPAFRASPLSKWVGDGGDYFSINPFSVIRLMI